MVNCPLCGEEVNSSNFCGNCGAVLNLDYPEASQLTQKAYNYKTSNFRQRISIVFVREDVREDIIQNNYNSEALMLWILIIIISQLYLVIYLNVPRYIGPLNTVPPNLFSSIASILIQQIGFLLITFIIGLMGNPKLSLGKIFRIYTYAYLWISIISFTILVLINATSQFVHIRFVIYLAIIEFIIYVLQITLTAICFKTLFQINYLAAFLICIILVSITNFPSAVQQLLFPIYA